MTTTEQRPAARPGAEARRGSPRGVQSVKFSFYRVHDAVRASSAKQRARLADELVALLGRSEERMLTRYYSTVGTRADTDFLIWQVHDELAPIQDWHAELLASPLGAALARPHSFLSMTMRSLYTNPLHGGSSKRDRLREDGGADGYLFVYPMVKTRAWYKLPRDERQRIMNEHIEVGHGYHEIKINTTYSTASTIRSSSSRSRATTPASSSPSSASCGTRRPPPTPSATRRCSPAAASRARRSWSPTSASAPRGSPHQSCPRGSPHQRSTPGSRREDHRNVVHEALTGVAVLDRREIWGCEPRNEQP